MPTDGDASEQWKFPGELPAVAREEESDEDGSPWCDLTSVSAEEARAICVTLESEGIPVAAKTSAESRVLIRVPENLLEAAREALASNANEVDAESAAFDQDHEERLVTAWICPKCHARRLVILPMPPRWRRALQILLLLILLPVPISFMDIEIVWPPWVFLAWFFVFVALITCYAGSPRGKRCLECGWQKS